MKTHYIAWLHRSSSPLYEAVITNDLEKVKAMLTQPDVNIHHGLLEISSTDSYCLQQAVTPLMATRRDNPILFNLLLAQYARQPEYYLPGEKCKSDLSEVIQQAAVNHHWQRILACSNMLKRNLHYLVSGPAHTALRHVIYTQLHAHDPTAAIDPATLYQLLDNELTHYLLQNQQRHHAAFNTSVKGVAFGVLRFHVFGRAVMIGGYSASEKQAAADALRGVLRQELSLTALEPHAGALHNGKLSQLTALVLTYLQDQERAQADIMHLGL